MILNATESLLRNLRHIFYLKFNNWIRKRQNCLRREKSMHTQLVVSEYNCIYFHLFIFLSTACVPTTELLFWRVMSLLTHRLAASLCLWYPEKECRTVAHSKSHRTQAPLALTSTLELLRSPWATGGLRASARKRGKIWVEGLMAAKCRVWMLIIRTEVMNPYFWTQTEQSNYPICTSKQNTHTYHVYGGQSEDTQAPVTKRGITSVSMSSRRSFHAKMWKENPEIKK